MKRRRINLDDNKNNFHISQYESYIIMKQMFVKFYRSKNRHFLKCFCLLTKNLKTENLSI